MGHESRYRFLLDEDEELHYDYDAAGDVMYLWRGPAPRAAISHETPDGHLVRTALDDGEVCGFTIFNWHRDGWSERGRIEFAPPPVGPDERQPDEHDVYVCFAA